MDFLSQSHMPNSMDFGLLGSVLFPRGWELPWVFLPSFVQKLSMLGTPKSMAEIGDENWGLRQAGSLGIQFIYIYIYIHIYIYWLVVWNTFYFPYYMG